MAFPLAGDKIWSWDVDRGSALRSSRTPHCTRIMTSLTKYLLLLPSPRSPQAKFPPTPHAVGSFEDPPDNLRELSVFLLQKVGYRLGTYFCFWGLNVFAFWGVKGELETRVKPAVISGCDSIPTPFYLVRSPMGTQSNVDQK